MKVEVKKVDALKRELKFEIPKDRVAKKMEEVFADISKAAKVKGYRPGKAPRNVIEAEHGALAKEETVKALIPEVYQEALGQEKITPVDMPEITDVRFKDGILTFTAHVDIKPEVKIKKYKGIEIKRKSSEITDEELAKTLEFFRQSQGKDKETQIDDAFARGLGYPGLEDFKKSLRRQMEMDKDRQSRIDVENQIVEALLKDAQLAVPQSMVKKQLEYRIHDAKHRMEHQHLPAEEIAKREKELRKELPEAVERDVKIYLIFDKIAELENIQTDQENGVSARVMEFLLKEAAWKDGK